MNEILSQELDETLVMKAEADDALREAIAERDEGNEARIVLEEENLTLRSQLEALQSSSISAEQSDAVRHTVAG